MLLGLPLPAFPPHIQSQLIVPALVIAIVGFSLSIATGKTLAEKNNYEINPNQEMVAHGLANCLGSIFLGYPAFASLSRSAICHSLHAESPLHSFIAAAVVMIVLQFLTSVRFFAFNTVINTKNKTLRALPFATLAAIILYSLRSVFKQLRDVVPLWHTKKSDFCIWMLTFVCSLLIGIEYGLLIGVSLSMLFLLYSETYPPTSILGQLPDLPWLFKYMDRFGDAKDIPCVLIFRFGSALHFANKDWLVKELFKGIQSRTKTIHTVVLDASSLNYTDVTGIRALQKIQVKLNTMDIELLLCNCRGSFRDALKMAGFTAPRYLSIYDAVRYAAGKQIHQEAVAEEATDAIANC